MTTTVRTNLQNRRIHGIDVLTENLKPYVFWMYSNSRIQF